MPAYVADLHNHTPLLPTDYRGPADTTADDVVRAAADAGIDILGVTDHFCADYVRKLAEAASKHAEKTGHRILVLGGAELKLQSGNDEVHLIALFEPNMARVQLRSVLSEFGVTCSMTESHELPHLVADADPIEVAGRIRQEGGIAIAGHIDRVFGDYRLSDSSYLMEIVYSNCFDAIEVTEQSTSDWLQQMTTPAVIASSDSHATGEMGRRRTLVAMKELTFDELKKALARGSTVPMLAAPPAPA
jgi:PHP family Zn ribbon phosphoesterase